MDRLLRVAWAWTAYRIRRLIPEVRAVEQARRRRIRRRDEAIDQSLIGLGLGD